MREGAAPEDIAAGFSYSVVRNCLFKVLKLKNTAELGDNVVVQGGTFRNHSIVRALEKTLGLRAGFSDQSSEKLYDKGIRYTMSDNICFPAKLMHGHIINLAEKHVDRILYPYTVYGRKDDPKASNSYNCPIVSGYSDVLRSSMSEIAGRGIPLDSPTVSFADRNLAAASCVEYLRKLGVSRRTAEKAVEKAFAAQEQYGKALTARASEVLSRAMAEGRTVILLACRPYHIDPMIEHRISAAIAGMGIDVITENIATEAGTEVYSHLNAVSQWAWPNRIFKSAWFAARHPYPRLHFVELTSFGCGPDAFILDEVGSILRRYGKNLTALKIDDVSNIGSLKLRIRSLVESTASAGTVPAVPHVTERLTTRRFETSDRGRTIVVPYFAEGYSEFIPSVLKVMGYDAISLPPGTQDDVETGLRCANNDICYPATIVVGSIINFLKSGKLPREKTAVIMYQTGGQCRATNYFALIQNAMCAEGFSDIPLISISKNSELTANQPGFDPDWKHNLRLILYTVLYADCLSKLYHTAVTREKQKGRAASLRHKYTELGKALILRRDCRGVKDLTGQAAREFAAAIRTELHPSIIGIVGEIYVKYNSLSNKDVVRWLNSHGIETAVPSVYNFFISAFANRHINKRENIKKLQTPLWATDALYLWMRSCARAFDRACSPCPGYRPFSDVFEDAAKASRIVSLAGDFGEGWSLPAEIAGLAEEGIQKVVSLQPFGCIANHIISKGVEKRIKELYPGLSLLFLDFDSNTSEANIYNRLQFMIQNDGQ